MVEIYDAFLALLKKKIADFYSSDVKASKDYAHIISPAHFERLHKILQENKQHIHCGGESDAATRFIAPTVFTNLPATSSLMADELFGPLLPVFKYDGKCHRSSHLLVLHTSQAHWPVQTSSKWWTSSTPARSR